MTGASAAARAIFAGGGAAEPVSLQELHQLAARSLQLAEEIDGT
jgi:hypothetical protein